MLQNSHLLDGVDIFAVAKINIEARGKGQRGGQDAQQYVFMIGEKFLESP
jgi:hypothetical protein